VLLIHPKYSLNDKASAIYLSVELAFWNPESDEQTDFRPLYEFEELPASDHAEPGSGQRQEHATQLKEQIDKVTMRMAERLAAALGS